MSASFDPSGAACANCVSASNKTHNHLDMGSEGTTGLAGTEIQAVWALGRQIKFLDVDVSGLKVWLHCHGSGGTAVRCHNGFLFLPLFFRFFHIWTTPCC